MGIGARLGRVCRAVTAAFALFTAHVASAERIAADTAPAGADALPTVGAPVDHVLDRALERGEFRFGHRRDAPPFSYTDAAGRPAGLAVRLCDAIAPAIAAAAGEPQLPVRWVDVTAATRFEALITGEIDLLCGPATETLSRRETFDFSIPYFVEGAGVVFRRGGAERLADLGSEPVGVLGGTTTEALARRLLAERAPDAAVRVFEDHRGGLAALEGGEIGAYMADRSILAYQLGLMRPSAPPVLSPRVFSREPYALVMLRGESRLRLVVDAALSRLYASGGMEALIRETLGRDVGGAEGEAAIHEVVAIPE